jgi:hypothetical protein
LYGTRNRKLGITTVVTTAPKDCNKVILEESRHKRIQTPLTYQNVNEDNMESYQKKICGKHVLPPNDNDNAKKRHKATESIASNGTTEQSVTPGIVTLPETVDLASNRSRKDDESAALPTMIVATKDKSKRVSFEATDPLPMESDTITTSSDLPMAHYTTPAATSLGNIHQEGPFVTPGTFSHPAIVKQQHLSNIQRNIFLHTPGPEYNHYSTTASIPTPFLPYNGTEMEYNIVSKRKLQQQEDKLALLSEIKELQMELTKSKEKFKETINVYKEKCNEAREVNSKNEKVSEQYILMKDTNSDLKKEIRDIQKKHEDDTRYLQAELRHYKEKYDDVKHNKDKF